jgi:hypothetical protein
MDFHGNYLALVDEIERKFAVVSWRCEDFEIWPLARMELYLDMYWAAVGTSRPAVRPFPVRSIAIALRQLRNLWISRNHLDHLLLQPRPSQAFILGDGVSIDLSKDGAVDRFAEPVMQALEYRANRSFLLQPGDLSRLPWRRPTYAANLVYHSGVPGLFGKASAISVPDIAVVAEFLANKGVASPSMTAHHLAHVATRVSRSARSFERLLRQVRPEMAFVVNYYSNLGPALMLACRRQRILSIDLQHCPQGTHQAYRWAQLPKSGYATLPAVFWNWTEQDAAAIRRSTEQLAVPWHRSIHGGHTQLAGYLDDRDPANLEWDRKFGNAGGGGSFEKEVLLALQPVGNRGAAWEATAR